MHGVAARLQASRLAAEGLVGIAVAQHRAAMVEVFSHVVLSFITSVTIASLSIIRCHSVPAMTSCIPFSLQVNSETDFVAKNERFRELVKSIAQTALDADLPIASGQSCIC